MIFNGRAFDVSTHMMNTNRRLQSELDSAKWFSEFRLLNLDNICVVYPLLLEFHKNHLCCFLTGTYVCYLAVLVNAYMSAALYVVMTDCPLYTSYFNWAIHTSLLFHRRLPVYPG
jgi:hypothetical protein